jgi:DNA-binding transcriptional ArsR family regulator
MQPDLSRKVIRMLVERILEKVLPKESGAARLQQIGLFTMIYMLQGDKEPVTVSRLTRLTGQGDAQINKHLRKLIDEELVERTQILNKQGRGRAFHLSIKHTPKTKRLLAAIDKATKRKR